MAFSRFLPLPRHSRLDETLFLRMINTVQKGRFLMSFLWAFWLFALGKGTSPNLGLLSCMHPVSNKQRKKKRKRGGGYLRWMHAGIFPVSCFCCDCRSNSSPTPVPGRVPSVLCRQATFSSTQKPKSRGHGQMARDKASTGTEKEAAFTIHQCTML